MAERAGERGAARAFGEQLEILVQTVRAAAHPIRVGVWGCGEGGGGGARRPDFRLVHDAARPTRKTRAM